MRKCAGKFWKVREVPETTRGRSSTLFGRSSPFLVEGLRVLGGGPDSWFQVPADCVGDTMALPKPCALKTAQLQELPVILDIWMHYGCSSNRIGSDGRQNMDMLVSIVA